MKEGYYNELLPYYNIFISVFSVLDQAWNMLRIYINNRLDNYELQECVISKLLLGGSELPQWLIDIVKVTLINSLWIIINDIYIQENNPSGLLRIYLQYDYIEYAVHLIIEYIDAIIGHGKEYFGLKVSDVVITTHSCIIYMYIFNIECTSCD